MSDQISREHQTLEPPHWIQTCLMAGFGGMLPTLVKFATIYAAAPRTPMPEPGVYLALGIFFVIGLGLYHGLKKDKTLREAIVLGIVAPALITNIVSGAGEAQTGRSMQTVGHNMLVATAYAAEVKTETTPDTGIPTGKRMVNIKISPPSEMMTGVTSSDIYVSAVRKHPMTGTSETIKYGKVPVGGWAAYPIPEGVESFKFSAKGFAAKEVESEIKLPKGTPTTIIVDVKVEYTWWNDFFWALGYKRKADVTVLTPVIGPEKQK